MGVLDALRMRSYQEAITAASVGDPSTLPIATPWSDCGLERILFEDVFGAGVIPNTRSAALSIPALARARDLVVTQIARCPLVLLEAGEESPAVDDVDAWQAITDRTPTWVTQTGTSTPFQHRMAWTVDDLIFYGWGLWNRLNGTGPGPLAADRVNQERWRVTSGEVYIDDQVVPTRNVILFPGFHEGILARSKVALADAQQLYATVRDRIQNPVPMVELHQTGGRPLTKEERDALVTAWTAARAAKGGGGVGYTSENIELKTHGTDTDQALAIDARNATAVDMARIVGVSASRIDATAPKASLNYETTTGRNQELVDFDLGLYTTPIEARLSMDDICPPGTRIAFNLNVLNAPVQPATGAPQED